MASLLAGVGQLSQLAKLCLGLLYSGHGVEVRGGQVERYGRGGSGVRPMWHRVDAVLAPRRRRSLPVRRVRCRLLSTQGGRVRTTAANTLGASRRQTTAQPTRRQYHTHARQSRTLYTCCTVNSPLEKDKQGIFVLYSGLQCMRKPNSITLSGSNQLRTSSEPASVMEFGLKALRLARVNEESHGFTCHPDAYPQVE